MKPMRMPTWTGKAQQNSTMSEGAEDLSDIVSIVSEYEVSLLACLGDAVNPADSPHTWEDQELAAGSRPDDPLLLPVKRTNEAQLFTDVVAVTGELLSLNGTGMADELDYQKQERLRELLRDLENAVINGTGGPGRITGILARLKRNVFQPGHDGFPTGDGPAGNQLTQAMLDAAIANIRNQGVPFPNLLVVNGHNKRRVVKLMAERLKGVPSGHLLQSMATKIWEGEHGICQVVLSRSCPSDAVIMLRSEDLSVPPVIGRSFQYKQNEVVGNRMTGTISGEYTLQLCREHSHAVIRGLATR